VASGSIDLLDRASHSTFAEALENEAVAQQRAVAALREKTERSGR
jgi:hypothetical protein